MTIGRHTAGRLLLESLVIVASILAAFALDRWWESVQRRDEARESLGALAAEFRTGRSALEEKLALHERTLRSVGFIRSTLDEAVRAGEREVVLPDTALGWLYIPPTTQLTVGTLEGLIGSARLGIIRDQELRSALAGWGSRLEDLTEEEVSSKEYTFKDLDRVFRARVNVRPFRWIVDGLLKGTLDSEGLEATSRIPVDYEIIGVVASRYALLAHGIDEFPPALDEIDRLIELIEQAEGE